MISIEEIAKKYEKDMNEVYARANTKSKRKAIVRDLISFNEICSNFFDISKLYDWDRDISLMSLVQNPRIPFLQDIINNAYIYIVMFLVVY